VVQGWTKAAVDCSVEFAMRRLVKAKPKMRKILQVGANPNPDATNIT
jgi:hypothetical protein